MIFYATLARYADGLAGRWPNVHHHAIVQRKPLQEKEEEAGAPQEGLLVDE